jgi:hypothetical protein
VTNPAVEFWDIVGRRADPEEFAVGVPVIIEADETEWVVVISKAWDDADGNRKLAFRLPEPGEIDERPTLRIVAE